MQGKTSDTALPAKPEPDLYRVKAVAEKTSLTYRTLHRAIKAGRIHALKCAGAVLIPRSEVERILTKGF